MPFFLSSKIRPLYFLIIGIAILGWMVFLFLTKPSAMNARSVSPVVVAITQIAPHPSLDQIRLGIIDTLKPEKLAEEHIAPVEILFQNAQGNMATATQIAKKFASLLPQVIVPITTPSAQTVYNVAKDMPIPIVFAAVSDPTTAKLVPTSENSFITGISDLAPVDEQAHLIAEIFKGQISLPVGIVYNPGEANAVHLVNLITEALSEHNIKVVKATASNTTEVAAATQSLMGRVFAIYLPNDNTIISALEAVLKTAHERKVPVFCSDPESVERGCLAAIAPDQYAMGQQVGHMIIKILKGQDIRTLPIEQAQKNIFVLNLKVATDLGLSIPPALQQKADRLIQPMPQ